MTTEDVALLRELRVFDSWTITDLAKRFGICNRTVIRIVHGHTHMDAGGPIQGIHDEFTRDEVREFDLYPPITSADVPWVGDRCHDCGGLYYGARCHRCFVVSQMKGETNGKESHVRQAV